MSDSALPMAPSPWLSVRIDHHFGCRAADFHLHTDFQLHTARTVLFGPSGSGKSSLLRLIAGLLEPDAGTVEILGTTVWHRVPGHSAQFHIPAEKRRVGLVMQAPAVFPHLTAMRNVAFPLRAMERQAREEESLKLLRMVEAEALANHWPRELSGGQLQRIAMARALASKPAILLLDEPFAALDARSRQRLSSRVLEWARERHVPALIVTHNLEEAFSAGDEVLAMKEGAIVAQGPPEEVLAEDRNRLLQILRADNEMEGREADRPARRMSQSGRS